MSEYITKIRTEQGDKQIDYRYLANLPTIDTSLKLSGQPADAQATGMAINNLQESLNTFENKSDIAVNEIHTRIDELNTLVGDSPVEEQIQQLSNEVTLNLFKKAETAVYTGTFSSNGWISESGYHSQTITVDGIQGDDTPLVDIDLSDVTNYVTVIENWSFVGRVSVSANNTVVAYCYEDKPVADIPVILKVIR